MNEREEGTPVGGERLIASFGEARLVQGGDRLRLLGGSMADRIEAMEWVSMFMPGEWAELRKGIAGEPEALAER